MNRDLLRVIKAFAAVCVLVFIAFTVRGWWNEYKTAPRPKTAVTAENPNPAGGSEDEASDGETPEPSAVSKTVKLVVTIDGLNMREKPAIDGKPIRGLNEKERVTLLKTQGDWYLVKTSEGDEGWISANPTYTDKLKK